MIMCTILDPETSCPTLSSTRITFRLKKAQSRLSSFIGRPQTRDSGTYTSKLMSMMQKVTSKPNASMPSYAQSMLRKLIISAITIKRCLSRSFRPPIVLTSSALTPSSTNCRRDGDSSSGRASTSRWRPKVTVTTHLDRTTLSWSMRQSFTRLWSAATSLPTITLRIAKWILLRWRRTN